MRLFVAILLVLLACSSQRDGEIEGTVVEVVGDLAHVESFTVRSDDGTERIFEPAPGILFHEVASLTHLRDHLLGGHKIRVGYRALPSGTLIAMDLGDA